MNLRIMELLEESRELGWVLEPHAKEILGLHGLPVTKYHWARSFEQAIQGANEIGYPLVAKIVSPRIVHKSDVGGVVVGITDDEHLEKVFDRFKKLEGFKGVLLDQLLNGVELIVGANQDPQFGTVVLAGIGGTAVEIYQDVVIRMAPIAANEAESALSYLKGKALLQGHRGAKSVNLGALASLIANFSTLAHSLTNEIESIDLNPVLCNTDGAWIADARMIFMKS